MLRNITLLVVLNIAWVGCEQHVRVSDKPLTAADSLNMKLVSHQNVASFGAPPMIPAEHPVVIGEDVEKSKNGGEACLECHSNTDMVDEVVQTQHPERNNCMQCHIPMAEESATAQDFRVENVFEKYQPK